MNDPDPMNVPADRDLELHTLAIVLDAHRNIAQAIEQLDRQLLDEEASFDRRANARNRIAVYVDYRFWNPDDDLAVSVNTAELFEALSPLPEPESPLPEPDDG